MRESVSRARPVRLPRREGFLLAACALGVAAGCASVPTHPMRAGMVETEGVTIRAADGSFTLTAGEQFLPPFQNRCYDVPLATEDRLTDEGHAQALALGARRVDVVVPGRDRPLFGLLLLCDVPDTASGPGSRSYRITVPPEYVDAATGGRISAVFERVTWTRADGSTPWWYGWVLWLSDAPY